MIRYLELKGQQRGPEEGGAAGNRKSMVVILIFFFASLFWVVFSNKAEVGSEERW